MNLAVSTPPPRRRLRRPQSSLEDATSNPRPKKKKRTGNTKTKSKQNIAILRSALFIAAGLTLVGGIFLMNWDEIAGSLGITRSPQQLLKKMQYYQNKQIELIASIEDREQAKAATPQLNEIAKELAKISFEYDEWDKNEDKWQIEEWMKLGDASHEEARNIGLEFSKKHMQHETRLREVVNQLNGSTGLNSYVRQLVNSARTVGMRYKKELMLNKAKEGAYADGYSPVTAETKLSIGMQIQGIGAFYRWEDCVVKDVYQDGTVEVSFQEEFSGVNGMFDKKFDRDRLRIPDVISLTNTTASGTTRRIEGSAQPSGATARRIDFPPAKRPPTGREF